jgi:hypothetical protein
LEERPEREKEGMKGVRGEGEREGGREAYRNKAGVTSEVPLLFRVSSFVCVFCYVRNNTPYLDGQSWGRIMARKKIHRGHKRDLETEVAVVEDAWAKPGRCGWFGSCWAS